MRSLGKRQLWRIGYAVCCLFYVAWVVLLSLDNFDMVLSDYRRARERLQPVRIEAIALQELVEQCLKKAGTVDPGGLVAAEHDCLIWPAGVIIDRQQAVAERLGAERSRTFRKLVVFYFSFGVIFLLLPPTLLYLLLVFFIWLFKSIKPVP